MTTFRRLREERVIGLGIKSPAKSQFPLVALLACGLALAPSVWRWIDLEIYAFWTDGAQHLGHLERAARQLHQYQHAADPDRARALSNGAGDTAIGLLALTRVRGGTLEKPSRDKAPRFLMRSMPGPPSLLLVLPQLPQDSASGAARSLHTLCEMLV